MEEMFRRRRNLNFERDREVFILNPSSKIIENEPVET